MGTNTKRGNRKEKSAGAVSVMMAAAVWQTSSSHVQAQLGYSP